MTKRILTYLFCGLFLLASAGPVMAVKKKTKTDKDQQEEKADKEKKADSKDSGARSDSVDKKKSADPKKTPAVPPLLRSPGQGSTAARQAVPDRKRYDTFVDRNGNGIDDRRENLKHKAVTRTEQQKEETNKESAAAKDNDSSKTKDDKKNSKKDSKTKDDKKK